ncbi:MAG: hypothetical protein H7336_15225 [Bacteriovorax sp.]|nr:hypothetical protein [Bacteriovorax sp.]
MNSLIALLCVLIYFVLLIAFSLFKKTSQGIENKYINLIKPLIPSWKFYDDFEETRLLFFRAKVSDEETFSEWAPLYQTPRPTFPTLFVNNQGNLILAAQSHIQTLIHDIGEHNDQTAFQDTLTYKITKNLVSYALRKKYNDHFIYQFKLSSVSDKAEIMEDILVSPLYEEEASA